MQNRERVNPQLGKEFPWKIGTHAVAVTKFHTSSAEYKHPQLCAFERDRKKERKKKKEVVILMHLLHLLSSFRYIMTCSRERQNSSYSFHISCRDGVPEKGREMNGGKIDCCTIFLQHIVKPVLKSGRIFTG